MKAIFQTGYGSPDLFELREIEKPVIKDTEVLVKVHTASIAAGDIFVMRGDPGMVRLMAGMPKPKNYIPGNDMAGRVEAVGRKVTEFQKGDEVFGSGKGACAEFAAVSEKTLSHKPVNLSLEESAAVPTSGLTALQGLRNMGKVKAGQKVLINGASGGVGTYAVQIAKALGAEVTGVCSTRNLEMVRNLGADVVIDYTKSDFTKGDIRYDLILDQVANHSMAACRRTLTPQGKYIPNSGNKGMSLIFEALFLSLFIPQQGRGFLSTFKKGDLVALTQLIESGKVKPVIDKTFSLSETSKAFRYMDVDHASGKVLISI